MKTKTLILALLSLTLLFTACEKDTKNLKTVVSGRIVTIGTDDYPGEGPMTVYLSEFEAFSIFGGGYTIIDSTKTDENGNYHFAFTAENDYDKFKVGLHDREKPPLLHLSSSQIAYTGAGYGVVTGKIQTINIGLGAYAWIKLHVVNVNPVLGDELALNLNDDIVSFYGPANAYHILFTTGNINDILYFNLYRNNQWSNFQDTVRTIPFDTVYHQIEY